MNKADYSLLSIPIHFRILEVLNNYCSDTGENVRGIVNLALLDYFVKERVIIIGKRRVKYAGLLKNYGF